MSETMTEYLQGIEESEKKAALRQRNNTGELLEFLFHCKKDIEVAILILDEYLVTNEDVKKLNNNLIEMIFEMGITV